jgi:hypothetical protein
VFQSWVNDHAGIVLNTDPYSAPITLNVGYAASATGTAEVNYDAASHLLTLTSTGYLDGVPWSIDQSQSVDLATWVGPNVYLGFTGGTGAGTSIQDITSWSLTTSSVPPQRDTITGIRPGTSNSSAHADLVPPPVVIIAIDHADLSMRLSTGHRCLAVSGASDVKGTKVVPTVVGRYDS